MKKKITKKLKKINPKNLKKGTGINTEVTEVVTTDTLSENREEILASGRKYKYPLQLSKHRIVASTTIIFLTAVVAFFSYTTYSLYKTKSDGGFLYEVTRVIPFPVAKAGTKFVSYESYLFELRHYTHYYETQQQLDFSTESGKAQLAQYKKRALDKVVNDAYIKQLAQQNDVSVSDQEVDDQLAVVREQNRLGSNEKGFEDVIKDNFGWTLSDFKRSLKQQILAQKVVAKLDVDTQAKAQKALAELKKGTSFAKVAKKYSQDVATSKKGGEFGFLVDKNTRDLSPQTTGALFQLKTGKTSDIINNGYGLEILKKLEVKGSKVRGAHILFNFEDISTYINDLKDKEKTKLYIKL